MRGLRANVLRREPDVATTDGQVLADAPRHGADLVQGAHRHKGEGDLPRTVDGELVSLGAARSPRPRMRRQHSPRAAGGLALSSDGYAGVADG